MSNEMPTETLNNIIQLINTNPLVNSDDDNKLLNVFKNEFKLFDDKNTFIIGRYKVPQEGQNIYNYYKLLDITHDTYPSNDVINQVLKLQTSFCPNIILKAGITYKLYTYNK
jgi:hypothetical protein